MARWCAREHIDIAKQISVHSASKHVTQVFFARAGCRVQ